MSEHKILSFVNELLGLLIKDQFEFHIDCGTFGNTFSNTITIKAKKKNDFFI